MGASGQGQAPGNAGSRICAGTIAPRCIPSSCKNAPTLRAFAIGFTSSAWRCLVRQRVALTSTRLAVTRMLLPQSLVYSAVERKFAIIGEALSQLAKARPEMAARIPHVPQIVAFRNQLIHG